MRQRNGRARSRRPLCAQRADVYIRGRTQSTLDVKPRVCSAYQARPVMSSSAGYFWLEPWAARRVRCIVPGPLRSAVRQPAVGHRSPGATPPARARVGRWPILSMGPHVPLYLSMECACAQGAPERACNTVASVFSTKSHSHQQFCRAGLGVGAAPAAAAGAGRRGHWPFGLSRSRHAQYKAQRRERDLTAARCR